MWHLVRGIALAGLVTLGTGSALAAPITYGGVLSGANEASPNASSGTAVVTVIIDTATDLLSISTVFGGLLGTSTAAHIHCCTATPGVIPPAVPPATQTPSFIGFPLGVTSGSYSNSFDMSLDSTWNPDFVTASGGTPALAEAAFAAGLAEGRAYFNIHSSVFGSGEILAFLTPVPEPGTLVLLTTGLLGLALRRKSGSAPAAP